MPLAAAQSLAVEEKAVEAWRSLCPTPSAESPTHTPRTTTGQTTIRKLVDKRAVCGPDTGVAIKAASSLSTGQDEKWKEGSRMLNCRPVTALDGNPLTATCTQCPQRLMSHSGPPHSHSAVTYPGAWQRIPREPSSSGYPLLSFSDSGEHRCVGDLGHGFPLLRLQSLCFIIKEMYFLLLHYCQHKLSKSLEFSEDPQTV